jgi:hypothetical protein
MVAARQVLASSFFVKWKMEKINFKEFADSYCETQESTTEKLAEILLEQTRKFNPAGWFLSECHDMCSSRLGNKVILPYGPSNTFKEVPDNGLVRPYADRGSTYSIVAVLSRESFDAR